MKKLFCSRCQEKFLTIDRRIQKELRFHQISMDIGDQAVFYNLSADISLYEEF